MKKSFRAGAFLLFSLLAAVARAQSLPDAKIAPPAALAVAPPSHILAANELVEIKVFQEPDLDVTTHIPQDGRIRVPLIGDVEIAGKTVHQATRLIHDRLASRFLVNPQVTISVVESAKRLFTVLGQVQRPGTYRFPERQTLDLLQVIGIAGGYTRIADPGKITIKRHAAGKETVFRVDGKRLVRDQNAGPLAIEAGDLIIIGERLF